jgi:hypothetical protein
MIKRFMKRKPIMYLISMGFMWGITIGAIGIGIAQWEFWSLLSIFIFTMFIESQMK